jgi:hypothetical protein
VFDKQCFKKSKNVVVVRFGIVKYSVAIENKVFNRRRVVRRQRKIVE